RLLHALVKRLVRFVVALTLLAFAFGLAGLSARLRHLEQRVRLLRVGVGRWAQLESADRQTLGLEHETGLVVAPRDANARGLGQLAGAQRRFGLARLAGRDAHDA